MNQWSRSRKRIVLTLVLCIVVILLGTPLFFILYQPSSCSDRRMNGDESGIDCGGSCERLCAPESLPILTQGDPRVLVVATSTFEVVAVFNNPNVEAEVRRARYVFKLYDAQSVIPLKTIEGEAYVPKGSTFAIFEGPFALDSGATPTRATVEWDTRSLVWEKSSARVPKLGISNTTLSRTDSLPRLEVEVTNPALEEVSHIDLTALISDERGNIFAASKTFVDSLSAGGSAQTVFTWPRRFSHVPVEIEIITRVFPDTSYLR